MRKDALAWFQFMEQNVLRGDAGETLCFRVVRIKEDSHVAVVQGGTDVGEASGGALGEGDGGLGASNVDALEFSAFLEKRCIIQRIT
ncbi:MAG: hypothetical protein K6E40_15900 [Desulfovibrio sp.]|nr:hypothetical protein [Desulfovibrio sp.]